MKTFIIRSLFFIFIPFIIYASLFLILISCFKNDISKHPVIILGDSHTEFIQDPDIFNLTIHASPYFVHYKFAEQFMDQLKGKRIYLACNYHNLSKLYQNRLANDSLYKGWRSSMFSHLDDYHIFNYEYRELRPKDLDYTFISIDKFTNLFRNEFLQEKSENAAFSIVSDTISVLDNINSHYHNAGHVLEDTIQRVYLNKLINLLVNNNCEVVLLKMPVTNYYFDNVPIDIKKEISETAYIHNIRMLDLNQELSISNEYKYFKDYGHLNKYGDTLVRNYFLRHELIDFNH